MEIERITKYVAANSPSKSAQNVEHARMIPMSLARVRWLERDPEYVSAYQAAEKLFKKEVKEKSEKYRGEPIKNIERFKDVPLTDIERKVFEMHDVQHVTHRDIASRLGFGNTTSRRHLSIARYKIHVCGEAP